MAEFEVDVTVQEDFSSYDGVTKYLLIKAIIKGNCWEFHGMDTVEIDPPDR